MTLRLLDSCASLKAASPSWIHDGLQVLKMVDNQHYLYRMTKSALNPDGLQNTSRLLEP